MDKNKTVRPIDANSFCHDDFKLCTDEDECMEVVESKPTLNIVSEYEYMWNELQLAIKVAKDRIDTIDISSPKMVKMATSIFYKNMLDLMDKIEQDHNKQKGEINEK